MLTTKQREISKGVFQIWRHQILQWYVSSTCFYGKNTWKNNTEQRSYLTIFMLFFDQKVWINDLRNCLFLLLFKRKCSQIRCTAYHEKPLILWYRLAAAMKNVDEKLISQKMSSLLFMFLKESLSISLFSESFHFSSLTWIFQFFSGIFFKFWF